MYVKTFGFEEKRKQKRRVFRLCYNNLILIPRQLCTEPTIVVHVNGLKKEL